MITLARPSAFRSSCPAPPLVLPTRPRRPQPSRTMSSKPKLTQPLRPAARYRKGQAPANLPLSDSDEDDQQQEEQHPQNEALSDDEHYQGAAAGRGAGGQMKVSLREVEVDQRGQVRVGGRTEVGRTAEESSEEETEEEEEQQPRPRFTGAGASKAAAQEEVSWVEVETFSSRAGVRLTTMALSHRAGIVERV